MLQIIAVYLVGWTCGMQFSIVAVTFYLYIVSGLAYTSYIVVGHKVHQFCA